jgi:hypothetical protein
MSLNSHRMLNFTLPRSRSTASQYHVKPDSMRNDNQHVDVLVRGDDGKGIVEADA